MQSRTEQLPPEIPDSEIYELPAPLPPAELDGDDGQSVHGEGDMGLDHVESMSSYEQARRKMDRLLQGPVPEYSPPANGVLPPDEKGAYQTHQATSTQRRAQAIAAEPPSPPAPGSNSNSLPGTLPSPISPRDGSNGHSIEAPSPLGGTAPPFPPVRNGSNSVPVSPMRSSSQRGSNEPSSTNRSDSDNSVSPISPTGGSLPGPNAAMQRTPIDPSRVVYLGPLPENVQLPRQDTLRRGDNSVPAINFPPPEFNSRDSLGSNFTEDEQRMMDDMTRREDLLKQLSAEARNQNTGGHGIQKPQRADGDAKQAGQPGQSSQPGSEERINPGSELIHVPQMAERRYSWEESL